MTAHATLNGTITDIGGENCDQRGFDWGTETGVYPYNWTESGSYGTGVFDHQITGLELSKTYFFRAKAHNSGGWGYGEEKSFSTPEPVVLQFHVPMIRAVMSKVPLGKVIRSDFVIHLRKGMLKFEPQLPVKKVT
jgi:hypothetical protein